MKEILKLKENYDSGINHEFEFYNYICEDKSKYNTATQEGFIDPDGDFLIGKSTGFLLNIDFVFVNTHVFSETARFYEEHGYYFKIQDSSNPDYKEFWSKETYRRKHGMTANCKLYFKDIKEYIHPSTTYERKQELLHPLRITGDHYNFLNYGRILRSKRKNEISKNKRGKSSKKIEGFPNFLDGQYWNFKIDEFIYNNNYHLCKSKARRKGFSYMRGSQSANTINLNKNITVLLAAYELKYLTDSGATTDMVKKNLDHYETKTYWTRGYLSEDYSNIELGYKKQKHGNIKFGWRSKLISVGCRGNESAAVGKDAFEIDFEEAGKFLNLREVLDVTTSTTEDGSEQTGTLRIYGTGGTKDANWEAFASIFFSPVANEMMPFENVWDSNLRHTMCGFYYPQIWGYPPFVDEDGNAILISAWEDDSKRKEEYQKANGDHKYIIFKGQRANRPSEAFLNTQENIFASDALNAWITRLQHDPDIVFWKDGRVIEVADENDPIQFKTNEQLKELGYKVHPYIETYPINRNTDVTGCMRMFYEPYKENGVVPPNVYFITSDSVGIDKDKKNLTIHHSLNSFKVWTYEDNGTPIPGKRVVASYCGRDNTLLEYDKFLRLVCLYYNAKILPETNRGETLSNFRSFSLLNSRILKDPRSIVEKGRYASNAGHGMVIGDGDTKLEGLRMLKELLYTVYTVDENGAFKYWLHYIYDLPFLLELQAFNLINNFDRISDAILAAYEYKHNFVNTSRKNKNNNPNRKKLSNRLLYGNN